MTFRKEDIDKLTSSNEPVEISLQVLFNYATKVKKSGSLTGSFLELCIHREDSMLTIEGTPAEMLRMDVFVLSVDEYNETVKIVRAYMTRQVLSRYIRDSKIIRMYTKAGFVCATVRVIAYDVENDLVLIHNK